MKTIQLEQKLEWLTPIVEVDGKPYLVRGASEDGLTLTVEEMAELSPDATEHWSGSVVPSDETPDNPG